MLEAAVASFAAEPDYSIRWHGSRLVLDEWFWVAGSMDVRVELHERGFLAKLRRDTYTIGRVGQHDANLLARENCVVNRPRREIIRRGAILEGEIAADDDSRGARSENG